MLRQFLRIQHSRKFTSVSTLSFQLGLATTAAIATGFATPGNAAGLNFISGDLVVSSSYYGASANTIVVGQTSLPGSVLPVNGVYPAAATAVADGSYPNVFKNASVDSSFGITSDIYLSAVTTTGLIRQVVDYTPILGLTTSFPSKSELALNLTPDKSGLTFMAYEAPANKLDVSNTNTPGVNDITNPVNPALASPTYRAIAQVNANGTTLVTDTNAYSGNNGRAAILGSNGLYYTAGNAGNGTAQLNGDGGITVLTPGVKPPTIATPVAITATTTAADATTAAKAAGVNQVGNFNITQITNPATGLPYAADKQAKDNNFRGETIYNNTLYTTKGSGGNGINTVYQVGNAGALPTLANAASAPITILPGFSTTLANATTGTVNGFNPNVTHPFGLFFANDTTLYVADEGTPIAPLVAGAALTTADLARAKNDTNAGLEKWSLVNGTWKLDYVLQNGLNLGVQYSIPGLDASLSPVTAGLRNLTGKVNNDGTVSLYAITSTASLGGDQGADPNQLVSITDLLSAMSLPTTERFTTLEVAQSGQVLRGISFAPTAVATAVPEPLEILGTLIGGAAAFRMRKRLKAENKNIG